MRSIYLDIGAYRFNAINKNEEINFKLIILILEQWKYT